MTMPPTPPLAAQLRPSPMRSCTAQPIGQLQGVAALAARAGELAALDRALRQALPACLRAQTRLADVRGRRLIFIVPSSAWASRLRTAQQALYATAAALKLEVDTLAIKVAALPIVNANESEPPPPLSPASANHLRQAAAHLRDPELACLFLTLADQAKPTIDESQRGA